MFNIFKRYKYKVGQVILTNDNRTGVIEKREAGVCFDKYLINFKLFLYGQDSIEWIMEDAIVSAITKEMQGYIERQKDIYKIDRENSNKAIDGFRIELAQLRNQLKLMEKAHSVNYIDGEKVKLLCTNDSQFASDVGRDFFVFHPKKIIENYEKNKDALTDFDYVLLDRGVIRDAKVFIPVKSFQIRKV